MELNGNIRIEDLNENTPLVNPFTGELLGLWEDGQYIVNNHLNKPYRKLVILNGKTKEMYRIKVNGDLEPMLLKILKV